MSASKAGIWMPIYIGDYLADTTHLTTEQHGAYFLMLMTAWKMGGRLPADDKKLMVISRLSVDSWSDSKETLLEFWNLDGDAYTQKRLLDEITRANRFVDSRRANGALGGRPKKEPKNNLPAKLDETPSPLPLPSDIKSTSLPPQQAAKAEKKSSPKGTRLPEDWFLPKPWGQWACEEKNLDPAVVRVEGEKFADHWWAKAGKEAVKLDWEATWRNWVRSPYFAKTNGHAQDPPNPVRRICAMPGCVNVATINTRGGICAPCWDK